jgi:hypothetical protein
VPLVWEGVDMAVCVVTSRGTANTSGAPCWRSFAMNSASGPPEEPRANEERTADGDEKE